MLDENDRLLADFRRLLLRAGRHIEAPESEAERLALIDDLLDVRRRLQAAKATVRAMIQRNGAAHRAASAYHRVGSLRR